MQIFEKLRNDQLKVKSGELENLTKEELIEKCKKLQLLCFKSLCV